MKKLCKPQLNRNFWIYTMSSVMYNGYKNYTDNLGDGRNKYISTYSQHNIEHNDIIFIYLKNYNKSGFIGTLTVKNKQKKNNKKIKIFRDKNLNKYIIKLTQISLLDSGITINDIINVIKKDIPGYRNKISFIRKHICVENIIKLNYNGEKLLKEIYKPKNKNISTCKSKPKIKNNNIKKCKKHTRKHNIIDEYMGQIPIMMIPCKKFKLPKHNKKKYFIKHFKTCNRCEKIDNNNINILTIFDNAHFDFVDVDDPYDVDIDVALKTYDEIIGYIPPNVNSFPYIRIFKIDNNHEIYNNCILISWISKNINYGVYDSGNSGSDGSDDSDGDNSDDSDDSDDSDNSDD